MYRPRFSIGQFNGQWDRHISDKAMRHLLECLVKLDVDYLHENPEAPLLYDATDRDGFRIYYRRVIEQCQEDDDWADIPTCLTLGYADCEDLVCWRVAELRVRFGIAADVDFKRTEDPNTGDWLYHIFVRYPDGKTEDPSDIVDEFGFFKRGEVEIRAA
jgi:hypothetical protein